MNSSFIVLPSSFNLLISMREGHAQKCQLIYQTFSFFNSFIRMLLPCGNERFCAFKKPLFMRTKLFLFVFGLMAYVLPNTMQAQCNDGESEMIITIVADAWPDEISWAVVGQEGGSLAAGTFTGDTVCIPTGECVQFQYFDSFGDGITNGSITVVVDGIEVGFVTGYYTVGSILINCPPGTECNSGIAVSEGSFTAPNPNFWYMFTADSTGNYAFSTCNTDNTCNTIIYGYAACQSVVDEGVLGVVFFNDDFCGTGSQVLYEMEAGESVYVRVGDYGTDCAGQDIDWSVNYFGPIPGCMDTTACNYNPLAGIPDASCWYPTESAPCSGPDLAPNGEYLGQSMYLDNNHMAQQCEVEEGCLLGYGTRQLLKFGVEIMNIGNQPYWPGTPENNPESYEFASCHGHFHYQQFAESYLYDVNYNQVDFARKTSYAIINMNCQNPTNDPPLAAGCTDVYGAGYACQAVDVTDLDTGIYYLVLRLNATHKPDFIGRIETDFTNNASQVCLHLGYNTFGGKTFELLADCIPYTDCMGVPLGMAHSDCAGDCGGTKIRGDLNVDTTRTVDDAMMYLTQITDHTLSQVACNELSNDSTFTVYDAARLNACARFQLDAHDHLGGDGGGNHGHCDFPFGFLNMLDTVHFELGSVTYNTVDLIIKTPQSYLLGYELQLAGIEVTGLENLVDNYNPSLHFNADGHIVSLAMDEFPLNKTFDGAALRITFNATTSDIICIDEIIDVVNTDYHRVMGMAGACQQVSGSADFSKDVVMELFPNPAQDKVQIRLQGGMTEQATISLTDLTGRVVRQWSADDHKNKLEINVADIPAGVYIVSVQAADFVASQRLVIE
jgi:Lysyl oxidase/Secretion system C-terminal sorting domain